MPPILERLGLLYRVARVGLQAARLKPSSSFTVPDLIEDQVAARGDQPFVLFEDRRVSYREYNALANRIAHWAKGEGLGPGDVVALLMQNRPEYVAVWTGLAKLGVATALINHHLSGPALAYALDAVPATRLIAGSECLENWASLGLDEPEGLLTYVLRDPAEPERADLISGARDLDATLAEQPAENPPRAWRTGVRYGDALVYIYTSGTTGLPKAAKMSHLRFHMVGAAAQICGLRPDDAMYCALPLYHSAGGAMCVMGVLRTGATLALRRRFSAGRFWEDVRRSRAVGFQYIGEFCRYLLNQPHEPNDGEHELRFCIGNGLRPDIWEQFRDRFRIPRIVEFYGATEGNVALLNLDNKVGSVGRRSPALIPAPRIVRYDVERDVHVRGPDGLCIECVHDEIGEIIGEIPGDPDQPRGRFEGYTSKADTEKKILRDVLRIGDAWFRTGDLLKMDAQGYYYFVDRIGDTFRWKGENVSTQEVAEALGGFAGAQFINVYGVEVPGAEGRAGMVALVLDQTERFDGRELYSLVERSLPSYAAPVFVRLANRAELTSTWKLRKLDLQREGYQRGRIRDPLFVRDEQAQAYVPLTPERVRALEAGELRI